MNLTFHYTSDEYDDVAVEDLLFDVVIGTSDGKWTPETLDAVPEFCECANCNNGEWTSAFVLENNVDFDEAFELATIINDPFVGRIPKIWALVFISGQSLISQISSDREEFR